MALRVNIPETTEIRAEIFSALVQQNSLRPSLWEDEWVVSLIDDQKHDNWELKLTDKNGISQSGFIFPEQQNHASVCASLLLFRNGLISG